MKVRILLTTLLVTLLSTSSLFAHNNCKDKCCKEKCSRSAAYADDCDLCAMFRGAGWRHYSMYHHDGCCAKEVKSEKQCSMKHCNNGCEYSWRAHRAYWKHQHYYHHDHKDTNDAENRG